MKGMVEFLDVEAEPLNGDDSDKDGTGSDDDTGTEDAPSITRNDDTHVRSPSPKVVGYQEVSQLEKGRN